MDGADAGAPSARKPLRYFAVKSAADCSSFTGAADGASAAAGRGRERTEPSDGNKGPESGRIAAAGAVAE